MAELGFKRSSSGSCFRRRAVCSLLDAAGLELKGDVPRRSGQWGPAGHCPDGGGGRGLTPLASGWPLRHQLRPTVRAGVTPLPGGSDLVPTPGMAGAHLESQPSLGMAPSPGFMPRPCPVASEEPLSSVPRENGRHGYARTSQDETWLQRIVAAGGSSPPLHPEPSQPLHLILGTRPAWPPANSLLTLLH